MKNKVLIALCMTLLLLTGCRSSRPMVEGSREYETAMHLMERPTVRDYSAKMQARVSGRNLSVQCRMRWNECIRFTYSLLFFDLAEVDIKPDRIVIMNLVDNQYCEFTYEELPYHDFIAVDFNMIQSLLWNRMFVTGHPDPADAMQFISLAGIEGLSTNYKESQGGWQFKTDDSSSPVTIAQISKSGLGYRLDVDYSLFHPVPSSFQSFPEAIFIKGNAGTRTIDCTVAFTNMSTANSNWNTATSTAGMKKVDLDGFINKIKSHL